MGSGERRTSRAYRSSRREAQARLTRRRVLDAATAVFLEHGFAGSTMRLIADRSGVSVPTVELLFGTKGRLLKAAIDVATAGDDEPVPVLDRGWAEAAINADTVEEFLVIVASVLGPAQQRSAGLVLAAFEAASTDPELADIAGQMTAQRATTAGWIIDQMTREGPLRHGCSRQEAIDTVWILMDPTIFDRLTRQRDWTLEQYQRWFADSVGRLLFGASTSPQTYRDCQETLVMNRSSNNRPATLYPPHGQIGYLQLPAVDVARSAAFYESVFGWSTDLAYGSFEAPGMIGQWTTDRPPTTTGGPVLWIGADDLFPTLERVADAGGTVLGRPRLDNGERWFTEIDDPAGNRIGIVVLVRPAQPQTMIAVSDVEASSRWYQQLLGLQSDHGGQEYERLLADEVLVLQLHHRGVGHHHGRIGDPDREVGNGVLLWFGDVADFDDVVARAAQLAAPIVRPPHRNPPEGLGNGPGHREIWIKDPDGYTVVIASPDGEAYEPR